MGRQRILITRPEPGASRTAADITAMGHEAVLLPFTEISAVEQQDGGMPIRYDFVLATSANAVRHVDRFLLSMIRETPLLAVGDATAKAASEAGFSHVESAEGDADALLNLLDRRANAASRVLYLCGRTRTDIVEDGLESRGHDAVIVETYETKQVSQLTYEITELMDQEPLDGVMVYSGVSAQILARLLTSVVALQDIGNTTLYCISDEAFEPLKLLWNGPVRIAEAKSHEAMMELLRV